MAGPKAAIVKRVSEVFEVEDPESMDADSMARALEAAHASHDAALQRAGLPPSPRRGDAGDVRAEQRAQG